MKSYFIIFTSKSALRVFIIFLLVGGVSIFRNFHPLWIATFSVVIYSFILWVAQARYHISLSQETKNSPYFMGFLLTMWSLFIIFMSIKEVEPATFGEIVIPQIGTAMLTTIVGLMARHILTSGSADLSEQEKIFKTATDDLQENVVAYKMAQVKLINLIDEFVSSHQQMMEQLDVASKEHLNLLSESSNALTKLGRQYPSKVQKLLTVFDEILVKLDLFLNSTIPGIDRKISEDVSANMATITANFGNFSQSLFKAIGNSLSGLQKSISEMSDTYTFAFKELPVLQGKLLSETEKQLEDYKGSALDFLKRNAQSVADQFEQVKGNVTAISKALIDCNALINDGFEKSLGETNTQLRLLSSVIEKVNESANEMGRNIQETNKSILGHVDLLGNEIKEIDKLVGAFVDIMKKRLH